MNIVYAKAPVRAPMPNGSTMHFPAGSHWPADDPFVLANPDAFSDDPRYHLAFTRPRTAYLDPSVPVDAVTETATAAPGERRSVRRPAA